MRLVLARNAWLNAFGLGDDVLPVGFWPFWVVGVVLFPLPFAAARAFVRW